MGAGRAVIFGLLAAGVFEAVTCLFRFWFKLQSSRNTRWLRHLAFGLRIHHGYVGVILLIPALILEPSGLRNLLIIAGIGLAISDLVHHFIILWLATGSPEFDLRYPKS